MMFMQRIVRVAQKIEPAWDEGDVERVWQGLRRKRRRRAIATGGAAAVALAAVVASGLFLWPSRGQHVNSTEAAVPSVTPPARSAGGADASGPLQLSDGSTAIARDADSGSLSILEDTRHRVALALIKGAARFDVVRRPERVFSVQAGEVTVSVLGTAFSVERIADRVGVAVTRGAVLVEWRTGARRLAAGEDGWFPPLVVSPATDEHPKHRPGNSSPTRWPRASAIVEATPAAAAPTPDSRQPSPLINREAGDAAGLLAAADRARLAGRFAEGAALLDRLVRDHPEDPRAPLAAFSLGRVLLGELGRPADAARAFARARALAPGGPLAEDALAREVEAWRRAGDRDQARTRAGEYGRVYPNGRRREDVNETSGRNW